MTIADRYFKKSDTKFNHIDTVSVKFVKIRACANNNYRNARYEAFFAHFAHARNLSGLMMMFLKSGISRKGVVPSIVINFT